MVGAFEHTGHVTDAGAVRISSRDAWTAALLFLVAIAWFSLGVDKTFHVRDEGYLMSRSARVAAGELPHRDFVDVYGPATFVLTGAVVRVLGEDVLGVHWFLAGVKAAAVATGYLVTRAIAPRSFAVFGALLATAFWGRLIWNLNAPYASLYTVALAPLALLALIVAERRRSLAGLFVAGAVAGTTMLFKQSLAGFLVLGMGLALWAIGMLREEPPTAHRARETRLALGAWALAGLAVLVPIGPFLGSSEYLLHILPIHALMALVARGVVARGGTGSLAAILRDRLLPFGAGVAAVLGAVALAYLAMGALGALWDDMFVLPMTLTNYARAVHLPPAKLAAVVGGAAALLGAVPLALAERRRLAVGLASVAALALGLGVRAEWEAPWHWFVEGPTLLGGLQPAAVAWAGILTVAPSLRRGRLPGGAAGPAWLALLFLHVFLAFQGFPRAGPDLFVAQGAQVLLLAAVLATWHGALTAGWSSRPARLGVALLLLLLPTWLAVAPVGSVIGPLRAPQNLRELRFPQTAGISIPRAESRRLHVPALEQLVERLGAEPAGAPVLVLGNEAVIHFASGRPALLPERSAHLFWMGWGMGSRRGRAALEAEVIERLERRPDALVVDSTLPETRRIHAALPRVQRHLAAHYRMRDRFGSYRILSRREAPAS